MMIVTEFEILLQFAIFKVTSSFRYKQKSFSRGLSVGTDISFVFTYSVKHKNRGKLASI